MYLWILLTGLLGYSLAQAIYRLYFHPLHVFPGPKIAAVTSLYQFFHDGIRGGRYLWEVEKMHEKYGPIVRINPHELHIKDPQYFDTIYRSPKQEKDVSAAAVFMSPNSMIGTVSHTQHRTRRAVLNNFFSKQAVAKLEPRVWLFVEKLLHWLEEAEKCTTAADTIRLHDLYANLTTDVITEYTYGQSMDCLDENGVNSILEASDGFSSLVHIIWFLPVLSTILRGIPLSVMENLQPRAAKFFGLQRMIRERSQAILNKTDHRAEDKTARTVFEALTASSVPAEEKSLSRLEDESVVVLLAGMGTTARVLSTGSLHLANNKALALKLRQELMQVMPDPTSKPSWSQLEQVPYLTAVINESLRLSHTVVFRLTRLSPVDPLVYGDYVIPPGTPVSQSQYFVHMDPDIFPDPHTFDPERWLRPSTQGDVPLTRFLVPFNKGNRNCLGMNLAYAELYITFAAVFRRFDLDLVNTSLEDLRFTRDLGGGAPEHMRFHVFARVREAS
ncbi:hypothetical protein ASPZODRAFT_149003 [Penicilliopsis zonata CBS 506.65]|uniref:Cytochrome P450 n=1 Tax=Penicilliopsis zonata CBS 506.65 TaxID=1073090 RepID=A0A1L9SXC0_9EURO|nr:hypothetical protein ASPZODRAFT_149003 [Penicilliopsis zonata CBS 506.65]OJJ51796.1 hypothetical protein ASPZODRAFT_149003 [Penicilliopsis zonata CBS 506.65]